MPASNFLPTTETPTPIIQPPGSGKEVGVLRNKSVFKVLPHETGGAYAILEQHIPAQHGPPLHVHRHETEIFYVLEGEFEITVGTDKIPASKGAMAVCPRDIPHTFRNVGNEEGKLLLTVIPGNFAHYFLEVDSVPDHDTEAIKRLCAKYEVDILS